MKQSLCLSHTSTPVRKTKPTNQKVLFQLSLFHPCGEGKHFLTTGVFVTKNPGNELLKKQLMKTEQKSL